MSKAVQFAFQGGGARLALLLPVVEAILESEKAGEIRVTRLAGTSAGAIAASLIAARADMKSLATHLRNVAKDKPAELRNLFPRIGSNIFNRALVLIKMIFTNRALASDKPLEDFLIKCLKAAGINPSTPIDDLKIPCVIISTEMTTKQPITPSAGTTLLQSLMDTTALPFLFRTNASKLDGGLVDNLPVHHLLSDDNAGQKFAVAFDEDAYTRPKEGLFSLALSLLDAAISSKTKATKRFLGGNFVLSLSPDAGDDRRALQTRNS